ncbi:MAG: hypothetical protein AB7U35_09240 [Sphingobium sp.]
MALAAASGAENVSEALKQGFTEAAEALCATQPELLLFDESAAGEEDLGGMAARRIYNTLRNVAAYFDVKIGALLPAGVGSDVGSRLKLDAALVVTGHAQSFSEVIATGSEEEIITGFSLPADAANSLSAIAGAAGNAAFLVSAQVGQGMTIDTMHEFMRAARDAQLS